MSLDDDDDDGDDDNEDDFEDAWRAVADDEEDAETPMTRWRKRSNVDDDFGRSPSSRRRRQQRVRINSDVISVDASRTENHFRFGDGIEDSPLGNRTGTGDDLLPL